MHFLPSGIRYFFSNMLKSGHIHMPATGKKSFTFPPAKLHFLPRVKNRLLPTTGASMKGPF